MESGRRPVPSDSVPGVPVNGHENPSEFPPDNDHFSNQHDLASDSLPRPEIEPSTGIDQAIAAGHDPGWDPLSGAETPLQPVWIWVSGLDLRLTAVLWANGVEDTERFIGSTDYDWLAAAEAKQLMDLKQSVIDTAQPMRHQASVSWGGKPHQLDLIVTPNIDAHGSVEGVTCVCFDITPNRDPMEGKRRSKIQAMSPR